MADQSPLDIALNRRKWLRTELKRSQKKSEAATLARMNLPAGTTRARVTTANAKWMRSAEHRDRIQNELEKLEAELGQVVDHG